MRPIAIAAGRRRRHVVSGLGLLLLTLLAGPKPAQAEASASDRATARALAGEGYAALKNKDYATAEDRFRRADELVHAPTLVLDHGRALVGLGRVGDAYAAYESVLKEDLPPNAPAVWKRAVKEAQVELEKLKPQVAWLSLRIKGPTQPQVEIDGRPLSSPQLSSRLPETPGNRHIVVSAPGFVAQSVDQRLNEGEEANVEVELQPVPKPEPVIVVVPAPNPSPTEQAQGEHGKGRRTLAYVSFGAAGLGIAVGAATGILWLKARSDIKSACGGLACNPQTGSEQDRLDDDKRRYDTFGTFSGIGFGVGVVGAVTGAVLLLTDSKPTPEADQRAQIRPYVAPGWVGVYGAFQ